MKFEENICVRLASFLRWIQFIKKQSKITNKDYRKLFSEISDRKVIGDLTDLTKKEILTRKGGTTGSYYILHNSDMIETS